MWQCEEILGGLPVTVIRSDDSSIVLINTFYVSPARSDEVLQLLIEATDAVCAIKQDSYLPACMSVSTRSASSTMHRGDRTTFGRIASTHRMVANLARKPQIPRGENSRGKMKVIKIHLQQIRATIAVTSSDCFPALN